DSPLDTRGTDSAGKRKGKTGCDSIRREGTVLKDEPRIDGGGNRHTRHLDPTDVEQCLTIAGADGALDPHLGGVGQKPAEPRDFYLDRKVVGGDAAVHAEGMAGHVDLRLPHRPERPLFTAIPEEAGELGGRETRLLSLLRQPGELFLRGRSSLRGNIRTRVG